MTQTVVLGLLLLAAEPFGPPAPSSVARPSAIAAAVTGPPAAPEVDSIWSLGDCLAYALAHHPDLVAEQARVAQSAAVVDQARAALLPAVTGSLSAQWVDKLPQQTAKLQDSKHLDTSAEVAVTYSLYAGRRWEWRREAATQGREAATHHQEAMVQLVLARVASTFGSLWLAERVVEARQALLEQAAAHELLARQRAELGKVAEVEAMRAAVNLATARDGLRRADRDREVARLRLDEAMGRTEPGPVRIPEALPALTVPAVRDAEAWREHPEWLRLEALSTQAGSQLAAARADRGPEVLARGNFAAEGLGSLPPENNWFAGLEVRLSLFDGGRLRALEDQARAGHELATAQLESLRQSLIRGVGEAETALRDAVARRDDLTATTVLAEQTLAIAEERYRVGAATPLEVFDAQTALLQVRLAVSQAEADVYLAGNQLGLALGRRLALDDGGEMADE